MLLHEPLQLIQEAVPVSSHSVKKEAVDVSESRPQTVHCRTETRAVVDCIGPLHLAADVDHTAVQRKVYSREVFDSDACLNSSEMKYAASSHGDVSSLQLDVTSLPQPEHFSAVHFTADKRHQESVNMAEPVCPTTRQLQYHSPSTVATLHIEGAKTDPWSFHRVVNSLVVADLF